MHHMPAHRASVRTLHGARSELASDLAQLATEVVIARQTRPLSVVATTSPDPVCVPVKAPKAQPRLALVKATLMTVPAGQYGSGFTLVQDPPPFTVS